MIFLEGKTKHAQKCRRCLHETSKNRDVSETGCESQVYISGTSIDARVTTKRSGKAQQTWGSRSGWCYGEGICRQGRRKHQRPTPRTQGNEIPGEQRSKGTYP